MEDRLLNEILNYENLDAVVVEGYDGVGKGKILNDLSDYYHVTPYRPDYNLWQKFDHRNIDRWKVSGFFWDIYSHFNLHNGIMLFDRGVLSGAVYNNDMSIASHYKEMIRDMKVLHILVTCENQDYVKFLESRNSDISDEDVAEELYKFCLYTERYITALDTAGVEYIMYYNKYDDSISSNTCSSCGHYNYGICRHPLKNHFVDGNTERCGFSKDKEVQDTYGSEMYSMQP